MTYEPLKEKGKAHIRNICKGNGDSLLVGRITRSSENDYGKITYNPNAVLPYFYSKPPATLQSVYDAWKNTIITWTSKAKDNNGNLITANQQLGEELIKWYDDYGKLFEMNANIIAAQTIAESGFRVWAYPLTSDAAGISQFTTATICDIIFANKIPKGASTSTWDKWKITNTEIAALQVNINGDKTNNDTYLLSSSQGKANRAILFQNVIDNPKIMIKAQFRYMKYITEHMLNNEKSGGKNPQPLASVTLFGYSRGYGHAKATYPDSINHCIANEKAGYKDEGINYVFKIFKTLEDNFGIPLGMTTPKSQFDPVKANTDGTNLLYSKAGSK